MWCRVCNIETTEEKCPVCGVRTFSDHDISIRWCDTCNIPIISIDGQGEFCPICGSHTKYLSQDIRPVFPEERLLFELLTHQPLKFKGNSVWYAGTRYIVDGRPYNVSTTEYRNADEAVLRGKLREYADRNSYDYFDRNIQLFLTANRERLNYLKDEATRFIKNCIRGYEQEQIVLSFSGGKDSTVTADIVIKTLGNPSLVHIFGDTTLEFPSTMEYATRYREGHPQAIFKIARNREQNFYDVCSDIGPPARMMRWCCSMFKTGPITRVLNSLYRNQQVLTFYGIRKAESLSRSKYSRVAKNTEHVKIQKQTVASPIFFWRDVDVWLYILFEQIDFNGAYRLGYDRVGCWCCPNNTLRAQFLSRIYMPEQSQKWREFLLKFAREIGKPDAEEYVDSGKWKARQGGNGLKAASDIKLRFTNCTVEDHAKIYKLVRPFNQEFINMMVPFGRIAPELGRKLIHEVVIVDIGTNVPIISIQPFSQDGYEYAVKIKTMNLADHEKWQRMIGYQVKKFNACRKCLKCESVCRAGAISVSELGYYINPDKCVHCHMCVSSKFLSGGCLMDKYLKTKE